MGDPYEKKQSVIDEIIQNVKFEGLAEGTPAFDHRKRQLHVLKCRELRGLGSCLECVANDVCDLYAQVKRDYHLGVGNKDNDIG